MRLLTMVVAMPGVKQMAIAQLCAAPKLRDKWLRMLESEEARLYFPAGSYILLERGERAVRLEEGDRNAVIRMLEVMFPSIAHCITSALACPLTCVMPQPQVPDGYDAYAKSIKQHHVPHAIELRVDCGMPGSDTGICGRSMSIASF